MRKSIKINYLYNDSCPDLVCDLTRFMDKYIKYETSMQTYLYNDLSSFSSKDLIKILIRFPGATVGYVTLKLLTDNLYLIDNIICYEDECFGNAYGCYSESLKNDIGIWIGQVLDFSNIKLNKLY